MKRNNKKVFETLVLPVTNKLYRFSFGILRDREEAKDVVQDVLLKIWNQRTQWNEIANMEAWCMRLTRNISIDRLRMRQKMGELPLTLQDDHFPSPQKYVETTDSMFHLQKVVAELSVIQQQVLHLRDMEGYSYSEISEILDLDMSSVKVNIFRARNTIKNELKKLNAYGLRKS